MTRKVFFDTNILIYAVAREDPRGRQAEELLAAGGRLSVQVLNEFVAVTRRKILMPWPDVREALGAILDLCPSPVQITMDTHQAALTIAEKYGYGIYDALVLAAALWAECTVLYSEDFHDGQVIDGRLTIRNPFV
jgi:predicted nucleic acid-binding protein